MSHDEEDKRNRSVELCQLIYDRQIDNDIGIKIRKLLEAGVLINFQDQNRNKKTALHLAVDKCDVTCVKFLLRFKPSLEVRDENGKTPIELAESKGYRKIVEALRNSTVDIVNETYIEVIDFRAIMPQRIEAIKSRPTFKVLKLTNCPTVGDVWRKLEIGDYGSIFNESSHLFFIAIETNEMKINEDPKLMTVFNLRRPLIVQLTSPSSQNTKIYFKDENDFVEITDPPEITQEEFNEAVESYDYCNMKLLVAALRSNLFGHFTGNLLDTKLNTSQSRSEAVNQFAKSNALCHRFFKLFDENLVDESQAQIERIAATLSFKDDQSLLALLDLPFELKDEKVKLTEYQQDILSALDCTGNNFLMTAVQKDNFGLVKLLLHCGCDFNYGDDGNRTSDICWDAKAFECLAALIEAGSPYPSNFSIKELDNSSEAHRRINAMIGAINSLHKNIGDGNIEEVKKFIGSHPHIKHAYDTRNKCALTTALQSNKVEIYSLLMSEGFDSGADDDEYRDACSKSKFKNEIRNSQKKYFKIAFDEPHLKRLLKMFRLSFDSKDRAKCSTIIRKMFDELNEIDEVIPILKICSLSEKLQIVFDFNCKSVVDMDPTSDSSTLGIVYPFEGFIYVGAKNHDKRFCEVIGTLIHELTHYAMQLTYGNHCKPYKLCDTENENRFETIAKETKKICDENSSTDLIVTRVFGLYEESVWHQELIVRVPHLLAHYKMKSKALKAAERNTPELFDFYRETTLKDVERESKILIEEYLIRKINNQTGIARKIENMNVKFEKVEIKLKPSAYVITSNAPQLTLTMLNQVDCNSSHIFVSLEQVAIGNISDKIAKLNAKESSTALIVDCIGLAQKYQESLRKLLKSIKNIKTIALVMTEVEGSKVKENFPEVEVEAFDHKWAELTESSKVHLLDQNVIFQGVEMKLNELVEPSSEAMNFFPLGEFVDCKNFKILFEPLEMFEPSHNFYIPRKFIRKGQANTKSLEELLRDDTKSGSMIISDDAGSGKSDTLSEVAKRLHATFPDRWVLFVDLKSNIKTFKTVKDYDKIESFEDFIVQNILSKEPKFNRELFTKMFRAGKTFVLLDGFDEISPNYKDLLLHVLKLFETGSGNQLFITTRPHFEADLEGVLGKFVFKLEEFFEESQKSFLRRYWQSVGREIGDEDFEALSERFLKKFSKIAASKLIGLPLLMRMTAEIFDDPIKENLLNKVDSLSIASVFRQFVEKYLARWTNNENEISRNESVEFQMAGGVLEVHHSIAINHILDNKIMTFDVDEDEAEKISKIGIVRYDRTEKTFHFIHQTFAEYFVADFIWFQLSMKNRKPSRDCRKSIEALVEVLRDHDFVAKTFLDQILEEMNFRPNEAFCKSVAKCLSKILKSINRFDILCWSLHLSREHEHLVCLLLSIAKHVEKKVLQKVLESEGPGGSPNVLHNAVLYGSKAVVSTLCDIITNCAGNPKKIYQQEANFGNVLLTAASNDNVGVLTTLCANLNSVLVRDEIKTMFQLKDGVNGQNIIIVLGRGNNNDEVFLELISLLPEYLSPDEIKSLLREVDNYNQNFFHRTITRDTSESLKLKFEVVKSNFDIEEQKTFFYQPPNMFHLAARNQNEKIFQTIIESTCDVLSSDEIKSMLKGTDSEGTNLLHIIAEHGNEVTLNELNLLLRERLSDDEIRGLLLQVNGKGQNCFRNASNNTKLSLQVFRETIGNFLSTKDQTRLLQQSINGIDIVSLACGNITMEILPVETIKELLTNKDRNGRNVFEKVARDGNVDTWKKLISFARARFSVDEMKSFLFCIDDDGLNCLHLAIFNWINKNMIEAICETIRNVGLNVTDRKKFVRQNDLKNRNVFHLAVATMFNTFFFFALFDGLSAILSNDEIKEMLKEKDSAGNNILCTHYYYGFIKTESMRDLIAFLKKNLTIDELKNLFFDANRKNHNFFHCAIKKSELIEIKSLSKAIKTILSRDEQKKFFGIKSPNVFHLAESFQSGNLMFSTLHECLKDVLTNDEIKSLIQEKNESENIPHWICRFFERSDDNDHEELRLRDFLKVLKVVSDADEFKSFLTSSNDYGINCLLFAALFGDQFFLKELFSIIKSELNVDDQRDLFQKCDNNGRNILTFASRSKEPEILSFVEQFAREILTGNQIEELTLQMRQRTDSSDTEAGTDTSDSDTDESSESAIWRRK